MKSNMTVKFIAGETHITNPKAPHSYAVETKVEGEVLKIYVDAHNRTQAGNIVRTMGYDVRSVNMEG